LVGQVGEINSLYLQTVKWPNLTAWFIRP